MIEFIILAVVLGGCHRSSCGEATLGCLAWAVILGLAYWCLVGF